MANIFSNFFSKPSPSVLGVDIGSSSIKIVQLHKKSGRAVLDTYGELALGPYAGVGVGESTNLSVEKIVEAINDIMREQEVNITTNNAGVAIPFASSLVSAVELPTTAQKELATMVPLEARKYVPVPISEVTLDWTIVPKEKEIGMPAPKSTEVLMVAIHNDTLLRYKDIITHTSLDASFFEIEIFSTMRSVLDDEMTPVMILDIGATTSKIYIVEKGILRASHTINRGSQSITSTISKSLGIPLGEAEILKREKGLAGIAGGIGLKDIISVTLNYVFSEANHAILSYEKKYNKNISKVILTGGGSALKGIREIAATSFETEVVQGNPFLKVVTPAFLEKILEETGPEFAVAVGLALRKLQEIE